MAQWDKIESRGSVDDRRMNPGKIVGGLSVTSVALIILVNLIAGGKPEDILTQLQDVQMQSVQSTRQIDTKEFEGQDAYETFVSTVLGSVNDAWGTVFTQMNKQYAPPQLVLFRNTTESGCGGAQSVVGPHYCPLDGTVYLDETFFEELTNKFGAKGGDVAQAYVIAHEVGHHVQNKLGIMDKVQQAKQSYDTDANALSIKLELQADCFAGLWAYTLKDKGIFDKGEISEAMDAASAVGDDRIQKKVQGEIHPESWTHGSSAERLSWFNRGYETGSFAACNTFAE